MPRSVLGAVLVLVVATGCGAEPGPDAPSAAPPAGASIPAPLPAGEGAYELAGAAGIEDRASQDWSDLHNVYHLSDQIVSGSEPHGEEALERIAAMGVKTILSVDGKAPDAETAARLGMKYVHVPIQYSGITPDERLRIAKTFREMEGPFFVHCFHGVHRGPAAAAVGRVVLDGAPRDQAIAEMRQWCGTSGKYRGLYETIARGRMPTAFETEAYDWGFPAEHEFEGFRQLMVETSRGFEHLKNVSGRSFQPDPEHPDMHPRNEAVKLRELFKTSLALEEMREKPDDYRAWLEESVEAAQALHDALGRLKTTEHEGALAEAQDALKGLKQRCDACHQAYRNN